MISFLQRYRLFLLQHVSTVTLRGDFYQPLVHKFLLAGDFYFAYKKSLMSMPLLCACFSPWFTFVILSLKPYLCAQIWLMVKDEIVFHTL